MKALPISIILFITLIICVLLNAKFIHKVSDMISDIAESLNEYESRDENLSTLEDFWKKSRGIIGLSLSDTELDRAENIITCLRSAHESNDEKEFQKCRAQLKDAAAAISRKEGFSIENIF